MNNEVSTLPSAQYLCSVPRPGDGNNGAEGAVLPGLAQLYNLQGGGGGKMLRRRMPGSNRDRSEISAAGRIRNNGIQTAGNGTSQTIEIRNLLNISYELFLDFETSTQGPLCG